MLNHLNRFKRSSEAYLAAVIVILVIALSLATPDFLTLGNWFDLIESYSVTAILAIGLFVVLVTGGIDISFAATASVAQYVAAYAATRLNLPPAAVLVVGLSVGTLLGFFASVIIGAAVVSLIGVVFEVTALRRPQSRFERAESLATTFAPISASCSSVRSDDRKRAAS